MTHPKHPGSNCGEADEVEGVPSATPSQREYALYIMELSSELARLSDRAVLPIEIAYMLRVVSLAAKNSAEKARH